MNMPVEVPMVHLVANIAKGWIWIEDRGWETERAALVVAMPPSAGSASAAVEFVQPTVLRAVPECLDSLSPQGRSEPGDQCGAVRHGFVCVRHPTIPGLRSEGLRAETK